MKLRRWETVIYAPGGPFVHRSFTRWGAELCAFMVHMPMGPRYYGLDWIEVRRTPPTGGRGRG